jgi:Oligosaccharyl transferase STT3 subunit
MSLTLPGMLLERLPACKFRSLASNLSEQVNTWQHWVCVSALGVLHKLKHSAGVFGLLQIVAFAQLVRSHVSSKQFQSILVASVIAVGIAGALGIGVLTYKGWIAPWTGRFYSLWDTGYAKK